jgi:hypothetical protein
METLEEISGYLSHGRNSIGRVNLHIGNSMDRA